MNKRGINNNYNTSEEYKDAIYELIFHDFNYREAGALSRKWVRLIEKNEIESTPFQKWVSYYYIGVSDWGVKRYKRAISGLSKSLTYAFENIDVIRTKTMIGLCYKGLDKKDMSLKIYKECLDVCNHNRGLLYKSTKASLLNNIGTIEENEEYFYEAIKILEEVIEELKDIDVNAIIEPLNKIDTNYKDLFNIYISKQNYFAAKNIISKIHNEEIRIKLLDEYESRMLYAI